MTKARGRSRRCQSEHSGKIINWNVLVWQRRERRDGIKRSVCFSNPSEKSLLSAFADAAPHTQARLWVVCAWRAPRLFCQTLSPNFDFPSFLFFITTAFSHSFRHSSSFTSDNPFASLLKQPASIVHSSSLSLLPFFKSNSSVALRLPHSFKHPPNQDQHVPSFPCLGYRPPFHPLGLRLCRFDLCFPQQCLCWFFKPQGTRRCWSSHSR